MPLSVSAEMYMKMRFLVAIYVDFNLSLLGRDEFAVIVSPSLSYHFAKAVSR